MLKNSKQKASCQGCVHEKHECLGLPIYYTWRSRTITSFLHFGDGALNSLLLLLRIVSELWWTEAALVPSGFKLGAASAWSVSGLST